MSTLGRLPAPIPHRASPVITVLATSHKSTFKIEQTLLDSGASQNCINRRVVDKLRLLTVKLQRPMEASASGGNTAVCTHETSININIAGVEQVICCYVEEKEQHFNLMLGMPALAQFRMGMEFSAGPCKETAVTITRDVANDARAAGASQELGNGVFAGSVATEKIVLETGYKVRPFGELLCDKLEKEEDIKKVNAGNETVETWEKRRKEEVDRAASVLMSLMPGGEL